ncbi:hypothetical protein CHLRE_05g235355v5 [Chlamydomonas reinhardtii]|uniref:Uncharacterized protein n=1 Tax=Chlamydomonas reinhardtii TaxID=3055 RepID=A0A2K3DSR0_CHLRE|nr:uncharacterized protein CHLRE_05g235355v5 [Chlamydomonas reinhardtii]PNW83573.1 hypothetical protein CHLRE_05g235355v5 [Chlamydomonas reinhardtii]
MQRRRHFSPSAGCRSGRKDGSVSSTLASGSDATSGAWARGAGVRAAAAAATAPALDVVGAAAAPALGVTAATAALAELLFKGAASCLLQMLGRVPSDAFP